MGTWTYRPSSAAQSLAYSAPELLRSLSLTESSASRVKRTAAGDVYSLAMTLYPLFTE